MFAQYDKKIPDDFLHCASPYWGRPHLPEGPRLCSLIKNKTWCKICVKKSALPLCKCQHPDPWIWTHWIICPSHRTLPFSSIMDLADLCNIIGGVIDVTKYFQNTVLAPNVRVYIMKSPYYLQWFQQCDPWIHIKYSKCGWHVPQAYNGIQGTKPAGKTGGYPSMRFWLILALFFFFWTGLCVPIECSLLGGGLPSQNSGYMDTRLCPSSVLSY